MPYSVYVPEGCSEHVIAAGLTGTGLLSAAGSPGTGSPGTGQ